MWSKTHMASGWLKAQPHANEYICLLLWSLACISISIGFIKVRSLLLNYRWLYRTQHISKTTRVVRLSGAANGIFCDASQWRHNERDGSTVFSGTDQRKHQSSASLAFVREIHRWPVNFPHKGPVTRKMFPFDDDVIMFFMQDKRVIQCYLRVGIEKNKYTFIFLNSLRPSDAYLRQ